MLPSVEIIRFALPCTSAGLGEPRLPWPLVRTGRLVIETKSHAHTAGRGQQDDVSKGVLAHQELTRDQQHHGQRFAASIASTPLIPAIVAETCVIPQPSAR